MPSGCMREEAGDIWVRGGERHFLPYILQLDRTLSLAWSHTFQARTLKIITSSSYTETILSDRLPSAPNSLLAWKTAASSSGADQMYLEVSASLSTDFIEVWINISHQNCWVSEICVLHVCLKCMLVFALQWTWMMIGRKATVWVRLYVFVQSFVGKFP